MMAGFLVLTLLGLAYGCTRDAKADPRPDPAFGPKVLAHLVKATNECRAQLGQPPIHPAPRPWHGDRYDRQRVAIWRDRLRQCRSLLRGARTDAFIAIRLVFGPYRHEALGVARCESRFSTTAQNGQYLGVFQMGSSERALYGHGVDALSQAIAAHRYFVRSGRDWSPWTCRWAAVGS